MWEVDVATGAWVEHTQQFGWLQQTSSDLKSKHLSKINNGIAVIYITVSQGVDLNVIQMCMITK